MSEPKDNDREAQAADLMVRYQRGDGAAFDALTALVGPSLFRFFAHGTPDRESAEDLYQETWLKVHHARHTYRKGEPLLPWLYGIARHVGADHRRRWARHHRRLDAAERVAETQAPAGRSGGGAGDRAEAAELLDLAMEGLPENQREALLLLKVEGLSVEEAAKVAGTSPGALKVRAHRAYARIRERVEALGGKS